MAIIYSLLKSVYIFVRYVQDLHINVTVYTLTKIENVERAQK